MSNAPGHDAGPWRWIPPRAGSRYGQITNHVGGIEPRFEANGPLVAAAPEMLKALRRVHVMLTGRAPELSSQELDALRRISGVLGLATDARGTPPPTDNEARELERLARRMAGADYRCAFCGEPATRAVLGRDRLPWPSCHGCAAEIVNAIPERQVEVTPCRRKPV